jgi:hypothetical protein
MALFNLPALENYLAARDNFQGAKLSIDDARDMVVLTVGNAYLTVIADQSLVDSAQAQVDSSKTSLDQAVANHTAGTSPLLDELRARVDYQTQQQTLINAQNQFKKDKIALARAIGLPLEQDYQLTDAAPYAPLDNITVEKATQQAAGATGRTWQRREQDKAAGSTLLLQRTRSGSHLPGSPEITGCLALICAEICTVLAKPSGRRTCRSFEEAKIRGDERSRRRAEAAAGRAAVQSWSSRCRPTFATACWTSKLPRRALR